MDLPGYGYAKISKAMQEEVAQFILQYLENRTSLRVAVVLVDIRRSPQEADQQTLQVFCALTNCSVLCMYTFGLSIVAG